MGHTTRSILKSWWLTHIDVVVKGAMEECPLDIILGSVPVKSSGEVEQDTKSVKPDGRGKNIAKVDTRDLRESLGN
jgi:hypothetical protein